MVEGAELPPEEEAVDGEGTYYGGQWLYWESRNCFGGKRERLANLSISKRHKDKRPPLQTPNIQTVSADLRDEKQCDALIKNVQPPLMLHLAWSLEDHNFLHSDKNIQWLEISLCLLRAFKKYGGMRFIFSGSSAEYGYDQLICSENGQAVPSDLYGTCKLAFTNLGEAFCTANNIQFTCIRYFSVYGPGESHLLHAIPVAIDTLLRGERFVCRAPNNVWDYVYITDVAEATVRVMRSNFCGVVNVGGTPIPMGELFAILAELTGGKGVLVVENKSRPGQRLVEDTSVLKEKIGFSSQMDIRQGLTNTVQWWKNEFKNK